MGQGTTESQARRPQVCAGQRGGSSVWPELVLECRSKPMDNGLETEAAIKMLFFSPGRNVKKMNFTFNLQMTIFSASY